MAYEPFYDRSGRPHLRGPGGGASRNSPPPGYEFYRADKSRGTNIFRATGGGSSGGDSGGPAGGSAGHSAGPGGGGGGSGGDGGSFRSAAEDQGRANINAAIKAGKVNNPDIFGPLGSRTIEWKDGRPIITETLSDDQQALLDMQERLGMKYGDIAEGALGRLEDNYGEPFDFGAMPEISDGTLERDQVTQAMMDRMQPFLDEQRQRQQNQLMVQGHNRGGDAWNAIQDDIARRENDARLAAVLAGGQEQSRLYELESANRARAIQEGMMERNMPLSEINALRSGSQPTIPEFQQFRGQPIQPAPLFDAKVASAGHQIALGNQDLTRQQMAMQDALARDQMALDQQIAQANMDAYSDASRTGGYFDLANTGLNFVYEDPFGWFG